MNGLSALKAERDRFSKKIICIVSENHHWNCFSSSGETEDEKSVNEKKKERETISFRLEDFGISKICASCIVSNEPIEVKTKNTDGEYSENTDSEYSEDLPKPNTDKRRFYICYIYFDDSLSYTCDLFNNFPTRDKSSIESHLLLTLLLFSCLFYSSHAGIDSKQFLDLSLSLY